MIKKLQNDTVNAKLPTASKVLADGIWARAAVGFVEQDRRGWW